MLMQNSLGRVYELMLNFMLTLAFWLRHLAGLIMGSWNHPVIPPFNVQSEKAKYCVFWWILFKPPPRWDFVGLKNYLFPKPLAIVVVSELLPLKPEEMGTILQSNIWYVAELWKITNMAETHEQNGQNGAMSEQLLLGWYGSVSARFHGRAFDWCKSRKQEGKGHLCNICQAPIWQLPNSLLPDDSMQIRGHQCGLNWNWSFTDFWITSWHGLGGV